MASRMPHGPVGAGIRPNAEPDQVLDHVGVGRELADRQHRAVDGKRRDDRVDAAAVGQPGVDHGARLVDPTADARDDLVDRAAQMGLVGEAADDLEEPPAPLDVDRVGTVDHHLGDVRVAQERLERAIAEDVVGDLLGDARPVGHREGRVVLSQHFLQGGADLLLEIGLGQSRVVELGTEVVQQRLVDSTLEVGERVAHPAVAGCRRSQRLAVGLGPRDAAVALGRSNPFGQAHVVLALRRNRPRRSVRRPVGMSALGVPAAT